MLLHINCFRWLLAQENSKCLHIERH